MVLPLPICLRKVCGLNEAIGVTPTACSLQERWAKFGVRAGTVSGKAEGNLVKTAHLTDSKPIVIQAKWCQERRSAPSLVAGMCIKETRLGRWTGSSCRTDDQSGRVHHEEN